ncbi:MAG: hypothetical protein IKH57_16935 [Clostridia bacterium]|nr:hypothetical protein [Clostridia bacterium]
MIPHDPIVVQLPATPSSPSPASQAADQPGAAEAGSSAVEVIPAVKKPVLLVAAYIMNKEKLWAAAEERLHSLYGDEPDFSLINRFRTEKNFLRDTDAIVLFSAVARVRHIANEHHTMVNHDEIEGNQ